MKKQLILSMAVLSMVSFSGCGALSFFDAPQNEETTAQEDAEDTQEEAQEEAEKAQEEAEKVQEEADESEKISGEKEDTEQGGGTQTAQTEKEDEEWGSESVVIGTDEDDLENETDEVGVSETGQEKNDDGKIEKSEGDGSRQEVADEKGMEEMENVLKYYGEGDYQKAYEYSMLLDEMAKESCVETMEKERKDAYRKIAEDYIEEYAKGEETLTSDWVWGYYLTDIDNDNEAELVIQLGMSYADVRFEIYDFEDGKAEKFPGEFFSGHHELYAYPGHEGVVGFGGVTGYEELVVYTLGENEVKMQEIGSRFIYEDSWSNDWFTLNYRLKYYDKDAILEVLQ